jgi:hypothetical protein
MTCHTPRSTPAARTRTSTSSSAISGLSMSVHFDEELRRAEAALQAGEFQEFVDYHGYWQDMVDNMDY